MRLVRQREASQPGTGMRYEFTRAWCDELGRTVTIDEAYREATKAIPPRVLTFRCPDPQCRAANRNSVIVGANYRVDVQLQGRKRMRYFRSDDRHLHIDGCSCMVSTKTRASSLVPESEDPPKTCDVVDAFVPATNDGPPPKTTRMPTARKVLGVDPEPSQRRVAPSGSTAEMRLWRVVSTFRRLQSDRTLRDYRLTVAGETLTYYSGVLPPQLLWPSESRRRILHGGARVDRVAGDLGVGYVLTFYDQLAKFEPNSDERALRIELDGGRLAASARGHRLSGELNQLMDENRYVEAFTFGTIEPHEDGGYEVILDSLFNVAVLPPRSAGRPGR
jgi:hypothetical protein